MPAKDPVQKFKDQSTRLSHYLNQHGVTLTRTRSLEALSRALHDKPWNEVQAELLKPNELPTDLLFLEAGPLSSEQLDALTQSGEKALTVAVRVDLWDLIGNDIEWLNDTVSEAITGSCCDLESIGYESVAQVPSRLQNPGSVWIQVSAQWVPMDND